MIPSDLAARLRILTEAAVQPLNAVQEIASNLPELSKGQRFTAKVEAVLPDGTFKAVVAGRALTLSLPQAAKAGDALDLIVVDRTPRLIVAAQPDPVNSVGVAQAADEQGAMLSQAARLIASLLTDAAGETGPGNAPREKLNVAAPATRAEPLLPTAPQDTCELATALRSAVADSGTFYEAHQARWVRGELPTEALFNEPQGKHSPSLQTRPAAQSEFSAHAAGQPQAMAAGSARADGATPQPGAPATAPTPGGSERGAMPPAIAPLPPDLAPVVRQQLDALNTHAFGWQGQVWPGQDMEWTITRREREGGRIDDTEQAAWTTSLRLNLPRLGTVSASLQLAASGVSILMRTGNAACTAELRAAHPLLAASLSAAGIRLVTLGVEHGGPG
jgi:hypothetical protein